MRLEYRFFPDMDRWGSAIRRPIIPVTLRGALKPVVVAGVLDSGGDRVTVPWDKAMAVGMTLSRRQTSVELLRGELWGWESEVGLRFSNGKRFIALDRVPAFVPAHPIRATIIGRKAVFEALDILFATRSDLIVLENDEPEPAAAEA